jgi:cell division protein ZapA
MTAKTAPGGDRAVTLDISLLGRDYKVSCKEAERAELLDAVAFLDRRMREIRESGKIAGSERIAVMAALNIAHDLQRTRTEIRAPKTEPAAQVSRPGARAIDGGDLRRRIIAMQSAIEQVLAGNENPS